MRVTDTHAHFWDVQKLRYPWIETGSIFDRTFSLQDYQQASRDVPIERMVFVECDAHSDCSVQEADWVASLAGIDPRIEGIVARVSLTTGHDVSGTLDALAKIPLLRGIRDNIQNNPPGFATRADFVQGVKQVHQRGWHFELCLKHMQLAEVLELVKRCPGGAFVLDHCAKPDIKAGTREPWLQQMRELAALPNVVCKISGLVTEADWKSWKPDEILWYARQAADLFGPTRILFGSDWPVNEAAGGFATWFQVAQTLAETWSELNRDRFFWQNAQRVYRLGQLNDQG